MAGIEIDEVVGGESGVLLAAGVRGQRAECPGCTASSTRVHSRYRRRIADAPTAGRSTQIWLRVRRFFCENTACEKKTFVEQVAGLTRRWARCTDSLRRMLTAVGLALAGRAGARLTAVLGMPVSRHSLLRLVRGLPDPPVSPVSPVTVLGVDDYAVKRGHHYGTVLVDCQTGKAIDLLLGRDADPLAEWLQAHPKPVVICRDRATAYAEGAATGAPEAQQVADRFHLWQNLATAVERTVIGHKRCLEEPAVPAAETSRSPATEPTGAMADRRKANHALVHDLVAQGASFRQIAEHLGWSQRTVARYAHAKAWQELMVGQKPRPSLLDPFIPYLRERIDQGCLRATRLHREVTTQGFTGGYGIVRAFVEQHRMKPDLERVRRPASVREVTGWICRHPDNLVEHDSQRLQAILERCPELNTAAELVRSFADMLTHLHGHRLGTWIASAQASAPSPIARFATSLTNDLAAVTAGLSQPHNSGPVEGNVNRIKMIKRQMYGRARFDLLRKRVLLAR